VAAGPFRIRVDHCGKLSARQKQRYGTNATAGVILTITRQPGHGALEFSVSADFVHGSVIQSSNVTGRSAIALAAGQSTNAEIDNLVGSTGGDPADRCRLTGYAAFTPGSAADAGTWPLG
jgi:hypothetical protein